ncbi:MAG: hypothetical protein A2X12_03190 [Bacteroidetes bacterium GWE2_29_8]|nr:MAG: hypothetical protein A2X12_03190 [Bacteroidetes bacterium GWE2_29_8]OFY22391.1 MAG: hypothetical protein A2X02_01955 [Bacteroidetes bacterium GWF2_29_10]
MKAIILAAGRGTRLNKYTEDLPKGMLNFAGKTIIERQIDILRKNNINDIIIVKGYKEEKIKYPNINYYVNNNYATTNMVESLMCAKEEFNDNIIIAYSDVIYSSQLLQKVINSNAEISVAVDNNWKEYWKLRYGTSEYDLESLEIKNNHIIQLGKPLNSSIGLDYRYIGLLKFSNEGMKKVLDIYFSKKENNSDWSQSGKDFKNGYMTDLLDELIQNNQTVSPVIHSGEWLEFDTNEDYEIYLKKIETREIDLKDFD